MSDYDHGPLETYEIVWRSGYVERVEAHQCLLPQPDGIMALFGKTTAAPPRPRYTFHGQFDGHWRLVLDAAAEDIQSVRNVTHTTDPAP